MHIWGEESLGCSLAEYSSAVLSLITIRYIASSAQTWKDLWKVIHLKLSDNI